MEVLIVTGEVKFCAKAQVEAEARTAEIKNCLNILWFFDVEFYKYNQEGNSGTLFANTSLMNNYFKMWVMQKKLFYKELYPFCKVQNIESLLIRLICLLFEIKQMLHITLILMLNKTDIYCVYTI